MKYLSVCSGIEAATVAWHSLRWKPAAFSEIEAFPSAVLQHHYPDVPNVGDMTKFNEWNFNEPIKLLVGGTPCQSFSVAGLRKGLADPRGNLALTYVGILDKFRPQWCLWENVPGVLSSNGGRDFGSFLGALVEIGYGFAYRVLDAQYFGVAQRRRRVFVVGYLGDWRPAAEVLFEPESLRGNPAPRRETGKEIAGTFTARARSGGWGSDVDLAASNYMQPVISMAHGQAGAEIRVDGGAPTLTCNHEAPIVAGTLLKGGNSNNPIDETLIPAYGIAGNIIERQPQNGGNGLGFSEEVSYTLTKTDRHGVAQPVGVTIHGTDGTVNVASYTELSSALRSRIPSGVENSTTTAVQHAMAVRRLTPVECERLQGFPDNYTNIPWRKQPTAPDKPRYKALGNSMAVPVMAWIGKRIAMVDAMQNANDNNAAANNNRPAADEAVA
jgi:DNA (cytosine-5)-methyltransferase 1